MTDNRRGSHKVRQHSVMDHALKTEFTSAKLTWSLYWFYETVWTLQELWDGLWREHRRTIFYFTHTSWSPAAVHWYSVRSCVCCLQDLLCYLIDDGGFLVMSNQKDHWKKVHLCVFLCPTFVCWCVLGLYWPLCDCFYFYLITAWPFLRWCGPFPDARPLQQLHLLSTAVVPVPVCVWASQQQPHRGSTQRHLCGKMEAAPGSQTLHDRTACFIFFYVCLFLQPSIADILNLAWWTSTVAWWDFLYCTLNGSSSMWAALWNNLICVQTSGSQEGDFIYFMLGSWSWVIFSSVFL